MDETGQPGAATPGEHGNGAGPDGDLARAASAWAADPGWPGVGRDGGNGDDPNGRQWRQPVEPPVGYGWGDRQAYVPRPIPLPSGLPVREQRQPVNGVHLGEPSGGEYARPGGRTAGGEPPGPYPPDQADHRLPGGQPAPGGPPDRPGAPMSFSASDGPDAAEAARHSFDEPGASPSGPTRQPPRWRDPLRPTYPAAISGPPAVVSAPPAATPVRPASGPPNDGPMPAEFDGSSGFRTLAEYDRPAQERTALMPVAPRQPDRSAAASGSEDGEPARGGRRGEPDDREQPQPGTAEADAPGRAEAGRKPGWASPWASGGPDQDDLRPRESWPSQDWADQAAQRPSPPRSVGPGPEESYPGEGYPVAVGSGPNAAGGTPPGPEPTGYPDPSNPSGYLGGLGSTAFAGGPDASGQRPGGPAPFGGGLGSPAAPDASGYRSGPAGLASGPDVPGYLPQPGATGLPPGPDSSGYLPATDHQQHPEAPGYPSPSESAGYPQRFEAPAYPSPAEATGHAQPVEASAYPSSEPTGYPQRPEPSGYPASGAAAGELAGYPQRPEPSGYPSSEPAGYPQRSGASGYPSSEPTGYPQRPEPSGYPASELAGYPQRPEPPAYPSSEPTGYPQRSGASGYPSSEPTGYPQRPDAPTYPSAAESAGYPHAVVSGPPAAPNYPGHPYRSLPAGPAEPVLAARPVDSIADVLPQRVPAEPDVPTVPEPPAAEPPAETPQLARIATHLRREDGTAQLRERPDGFDVNAILAAVRGVPGVRDASLRTTPAGAHSLRLDLADGADPAEVSRQVARLLQDRMGLAAAPQNLPGLPEPEPSPAARTVESAGRWSRAPEPPADPASWRQNPTHRGRATVEERVEERVEEHAEEHAEEALPAQLATAANPATGGTSYSGSPVTTTETAPSRPLNPGATPGPRVVIDHVQVSTFGLEATVEVRLAAGQQPAAGLATGPAVDGYVLRLCAVAAAAAIDELLRSSVRVTDRGRCFVEHAAVVPFGSCEVATVVVLLVCDGWVEQLAGSALVAGDPRQAVVRATLAAVNRRLEALLA